MNALSTGTLFGRYEIKRELGRGGMGAVYEAVHVELGRRVAIKTLLAHASQNDELRARFLREGAVAARVEHPHVVQVLDVGAQGDALYLVLEFLEGEDLKALLAREGPLRVERALDLLLPVLAGVAAAHREGVVHRDLKPANIFLHRSRDGLVTPKVLDFGIARVLDGGDGELTKTKFAMGSIGYMPPEQLQSARRVDAAADQYALGAVLYHCLTGRRAFAGEMSYELMHAVVHGDFTPPRQLAPEIPEALERVVLRAMRSNAHDRFPSVLELGRALLTFASPPAQARWSSVFGEASPDSGATFLPRASMPSSVTPAPSIAAFASAPLAPPLPAPEDGTLTRSAATFATVPPVGVAAHTSRRWVVALGLVGVLAMIATGAVVALDRAPLPLAATMSSPRTPEAPPAPTRPPVAPSTPPPPREPTTALPTPPVVPSTEPGMTSATNLTPPPDEGRSRRSRSRRPARSRRSPPRATSASGTNAMPILE